ncbi:hypothetical protein DEO23_15660 [Brachybacterium endophyticum]|uniref:NERD domain-containing protein n=1 Tax=Brachybacterium endophyticum TaxID=2182385 RepID=A0A2U2RGJ6_9MICO|nr:hypothetical protein [Brachybacterium endophyticum]PWH04968.1 hypothetical protein DEO23_15660 [Brachybacterium endophyticum]
MTINTEPDEVKVERDRRDLFSLFGDLPVEQHSDAIRQAINEIYDIAMYEEPTFPLELSIRDLDGVDEEERAQVAVANTFRASLLPEDLANDRALGDALRIRDHALTVLVHPEARRAYDYFRRRIPLSLAVPATEDDSPRVRSDYEGTVSAPSYRYEDVPWVIPPGSSQEVPPVNIYDPIYQAGRRAVLGPVKPSLAARIIFFATLGIGLLLALYNPAMLVPITLGLWGAKTLRSTLHVEEETFPSESGYRGAYMPWWTEVSKPTGKDIRRKILRLIAIPYVPVLVLFLIVTIAIRPDPGPVLISIGIGAFLAPAVTTLLIFIPMDRIKVHSSVATRIAQLRAREGAMSWDQILTTKRVYSGGDGLNAAIGVFGADRVQAGLEGERLTTHELVTFILADVPGAKLFDTLKFPGSLNADIDHALLYRDKLALIDSKLWSPGIYHLDGGSLEATYPDGSHSFSQSAMSSAHNLLGRMFNQMPTMEHLKLKMFTIVHNKDPKKPLVLIGHHIYDMESGLKAIGEFLELGQGEDYIDPNVVDVLYNMVKN